MGSIQDMLVGLFSHGHWGRGLPVLTGFPETVEVPGFLIVFLVLVLLLFKYLILLGFRVARPYKKNEQSFIESFNRTLRKEWLGWGQLKPHQIPSLTKEIEKYLLYYHEKRPHIGLGMKPPNKIQTVAY